MGFLPILVLLIAVMWFFVIRPQRKRQAEQQRIMENLVPGQEVMTAGGLFGTISSAPEGEDEVVVEIAPGVQVRVARRAIALVVTEEDDELEELERAQREAEQQVLAAREAGDR